MTSAMAQFRRRFSEATPNIQRSNVTNLRPTQHDQAPAACHPFPALFDHANEPDVPTLPWKVRDALRIVLRSIATPQSETRPNVVMAAALVEQHFRVLPDDAPAYGYPRPVSQ